jgi:hypothetical protein
MLKPMSLHPNLAELPDETNEYERLLYQTLAAEMQPHWAQLLQELAGADRLPRLLHYAGLHIPYYRSTVSASRRTSLDSFSIVSRWQYDQASDQFQTNVPGMKSIYCSTLTNGTIASPLRVFFSLGAWFEFNYGTYAAVASAIPGLSQKMEKDRPGVLLINNAMYQPRMSLSIPVLNGALLRQLIIGRSEEEDRTVVQWLRSIDIPLLYGKASNLLQLAAAESRMGETLSSGIRPFAVLVSGEGLFEDQRAQLVSWFQCPVYNAYIATESGLIAMECSHHRGLHLREEFVHVEIVDDRGDIVNEGTGEILITNLFNRTHVFIRYRLGDRVTVIRHECPCGFSGRSLLNVAGRETQSFDSRTGEIAASTFDDFLLSLGLADFQVAQQRDTVLLKWLAADLSLDQIANINARIHEWLRNHGWDGWVIPTPVNLITARGGKQRRYVRNDAVVAP